MPHLRSAAVAVLCPQEAAAVARHLASEGCQVIVWALDLRGLRAIHEGVCASMRTDTEDRADPEILTRISYTDDTADLRRSDIVVLAPGESTASWIADVLPPRVRLVVASDITDPHTRRRTLMGSQHALAAPQ